MIEDELRELAKKIPEEEWELIEENKMKICDNCRFWEGPTVEQVSLWATWGSCQKIDDDGMIDVEVKCACGEVEEVEFLTHPHFLCASWGGK